MQKDIVAEVLKHPKYAELIRRRTKMSMTFFTITLIIYAGFILTLAFLPEVFSQPLGAGWTMSVGVMTGVVVLCSAIVLVGLYVFFSNKYLDPLLDEIVKDVE